ncbi:hypothetical protein NY78_1413 [Desulfovibrio sp. TomC]|nr:hypothetical protein NY78_1413 [Desulfovibrio sp. TomC]
MSAGQYCRFRLGLRKAYNISAKSQCLLLTETINKQGRRGAALGMVQDNNTTRRRGVTGSHRRLRPMAAFQPHISTARPAARPPA